MTRIPPIRAGQKTDRAKLHAVRAEVEERARQEQREHAPETIIEPLVPWLGVGRYLDTEPPQIQWIFQDVLDAGKVGEICATGGTGKSFMILHISMALATGKAFGPFIPVRPMRCWYLGAEDAPNTLHRRVLHVAREMGIMDDAMLSDLVRQNLDVHSIVGDERVLIELGDGGNARTTAAYARLDAALAEHKPEVLFLDPKSRFFGCNENDNAHGTAWVACLERLANKHGVTILYSAHVSKGAVSEADVTKLTSRGAGAVHDGVRWQLGMARINEKAAKEFDVSVDDYVEISLNKNNDARENRHIEYFQRVAGGALRHVELRDDRARRIVQLLAAMVADDEDKISVTARELDKNQKPDAKKVFDAIKKQFPKFALREMRYIVERAVRTGAVVEVEIPAGKTTRVELRKSTENQSERWNAGTAENDG
jgi:hypothetical protein